ncbi:peroxidase [Amycolatopsis acidicola]|uniref:Peroxidase n=2 Tax=Amycolatopsis acidicola TaxID=2596893 RepID=A0A5N0V3L8_9PSEU|nr:peroxidase [Amycolatopsis acidicola]
MSERLMNGPSPLSRGERELILAYAAGVAGCEFVYTAHSEVAYAHGIAAGTLDALLENPEAADVAPRLKPLLAFVRKLTLAPDELTQTDANRVFEAGWGEHALHDAIAISARAAFMQRLVEGHGFTRVPREVATKHAQRRVAKGYVNLYPRFRTGS